MAEEKPNVYILRGDDREKIEALLKSFFQQLGDPNTAEMNSTRLDGKTADLNDLRADALSIPFLAERRLVTVENALDKYARLKPKRNTKEKTKSEVKPDQIDQFTTFLDSLPQTTALVLVIPDRKKNRKRAGTWESYWETLDDAHWLIQWCKSAGSKAVIVNCALPAEREMAGWIIAKAKELGGQLNPRAAQVLADFVGNNTQFAALEIEKLLTFVNFERPVEEDDVRNLCTNEKQANIFEMVDALGQRDGKKATSLYHALLEEIDFFTNLFPMVVRQFRLLIQARGILDQGGSVKALNAIPGLQPFLVQKIADQARKFSFDELEATYQDLLQIDLDGKTGRMPAEIALDLLIARLATKSLK